MQSAFTAPCCLPFVIETSKGLGCFWEDCDFSVSAVTVEGEDPRMYGDFGGSFVLSQQPNVRRAGGVAGVP